MSGAPYFVGSSELNAGVTMTARIENTEAEKVNLQLSLDASNENPCAEADDTNAARIDSGGSVGLYLGSTSSLDDVAAVSSVGSVIPSSLPLPLPLPQPVPKLTGAFTLQ